MCNFYKESRFFSDTQDMYTASRVIWKSDKNFYQSGNTFWNFKNKICEKKSVPDNQSRFKNVLHKITYNFAIQIFKFHGLQSHGIAIKHLNFSQLRILLYWQKC